MKNKIRILVEANKLFSDDRDGINRYVSELLHSLARLTKGNESPLCIDVFLGHGTYFKIVNIFDLIDKLNESSSSQDIGEKQKSIHPLLKLKDVSIKKVKYHLPEKMIKHLRLIKRSFHEFVLNHHPQLKFKEYDVVHMTQPQSYLHFRNCRAKLVTTVHDLTHLRFPQFHLEDNIDNTNRGMRLAIGKNSEFIAVSNATREDLLSDYQMINPDHVRVIHEACDTNKFKPCNDPGALTRVRTKYGIPEGPYLLSLSTIEPRKNLQNSIKAFLLMLSEQPETEMNFVVAGKRGWMHEKLFSMEKRCTDRLIFTGFVDDVDLAALYSGAVAFSYVSFYEGFGLPPLEAMSCGVPVVYGNNSSMVEVIGNGGLSANPSDIEDIKEKYGMIVLNKALREKTAKMALERAQEFSWEATARKTLDVYKDIAESNFRNNG